MAGTDYTIDYQVTTADGVKRTATLGSGTVYGNLRTTGIFVETDTVTVNLIPETGQTLPLISRGGSSMLFTMIAFGMILSVSRQNDEQSHDRPKSETLYEK